MNLSNCIGIVRAGRPLQSIQAPGWTYTAEDNADLVTELGTFTATKSYSTTSRKATLQFRFIPVDISQFSEQLYFTVRLQVGDSYDQSGTGITRLIGTSALIAAASFTTVPRTSTGTGTLTVYDNRTGRRATYTAEYQFA